jgi:flagellar hook-length control protein FliK
MNRPIDTLNTAKPTDWAAKLTANQASAANTQSSAQQSDFSRWMAQHATASQPTPGAATQSSANPLKNTAEASAMDARNALARAQANAAQAKRQTPVAKAETPQAPKADKPKAPSASADASKAPATHAKADAAKGKAKDGTAKTASKDDAGADNTDATDAETALDDTKFVTATGEGAAFVKELQPPETVASGDASSMLAWLARLTHGDASAKGEGALPQGSDAKPGGEGQPMSMGTLLGAGAGRPDAAAGLAAGHDKGAAGAIDVSALQATEGRLATLPEGADPSSKGLDFASTLSTEMLRGTMAGKTTEAHAAMPTASDTLPTSVNSPEFPQALAERVGMWVKSTGEDGTLSAELHLNPAEMGPISVKISLDGQSAQVDFAAANLETRRAIEASLPALSASLDDAGFSLGGSGVSDQSPQQQFGQAPGQPGGAPSWGGVSGLDASVGDPLDGRVRAAPPSGRLGGLDLYA